jgi:hypothetical protein
MKNSRIRDRSAASNPELLQEFHRCGMGYAEKAYTGLVSPCSTLIDASTVARVNADVASLKNWCASTVQLYAALLRAGGQHSLVGDLEWGLADISIRYQRESTLLNELPRLGRLDCVVIGEDHYIGEVQWKGAGEGYWASVEAAYQTVFPLLGDELPFGNLIDSWASTFASDGVAINTGKAAWMPSEQFLIKELRSREVFMESFSAAAVEQNLAFVSGHPIVVGPSGTGRPLRYLYLDRLTEVFEPSNLDKLLRAHRNGDVFVDPPASYIFNEKLPLSLPFSREFAAEYTDDIRAMLIPSTRIHDGRPDFHADFVKLVPREVADQLLSLKSWRGLLSLSEEARSWIVLKCASAHKQDNHGGNGVFRLGDQADAGLFAEVCKRALDDGEPWIVQPYRGASVVVPIADQNQLTRTISAHMYPKFGFYFDLAANKVLGGVTSFSSGWKVSGASRIESTIGSNGFSGAFRHDIRVANYE